MVRCEAPGCADAARGRCRSCGVSAYCSEACQGRDWSAHRAGCAEFCSALAAEHETRGSALLRSGAETSGDDDGGGESLATMPSELVTAIVEQLGDDASDACAVRQLGPVFRHIVNNYYRDKYMREYRADGEVPARCRWLVPDDVDGDDDQRHVDYTRSYFCVREELDELDAYDIERGTNHVIVVDGEQHAMWEFVFAGELFNVGALTIAGVGDVHHVAALAKLTKLRELSLYELDVEQLPASIGSLASLAYLSIDAVRGLRTLPDTFSQLTNLEVLKLEAVDSLRALPPWLGNLGALRELVIEDAEQFALLPPSIGQLANLKRLVLYELPQLTTVPDAMYALPALARLRLVDVGLTEVAKIGQLTSLQSLLIWQVPLRELPSGIGELTRLRVLNVDTINSLTHVSPAIGKLAPTLHTLMIRNNAVLNHLPAEIGKLRALRTLDLSRNAPGMKVPREVAALVLDLFPDRIGVELAPRRAGYGVGVAGAMAAVAVDATEAQASAARRGDSLRTKDALLERGGLSAPLRVLVITWNMNGVGADWDRQRWNRYDLAQTWANLVRTKDADVVAVCVQETGARSKLADWLKTHVMPQYTLTRVKNSVALLSTLGAVRFDQHLYVFHRSATMGAGVGTLRGDPVCVGSSGSCVKGTVGATLLVPLKGERTTMGGNEVLTLTFLSSHFPMVSVGDEGVRARNKAYAASLKGVLDPLLVKAHRTYDDVSAGDVVFWAGDMNYRIEASGADQLAREKDAGRVFARFSECERTFEPTCKLSVRAQGTERTYVTKTKKGARTPSYCDRILWRVDQGAAPPAPRVTCDEYASFRAGSLDSDHDAVYGVYSITL